MNGLSTLNRLLGKRNKDVSKSTSNLSRSTTNLDSTSQYNKIVPLAAMTNAPFEQTFRITVLLPREQLYVTRIGAKTRLAVLMDMVCSDKQLDAQKYLFRHPADFHQGFDLDLTIGEVGLNEIRLISKKELENLRNNEYRLSTSDIFRLHQKNIRENSVSSSDLSRTSRIALKTTSPYSSTNSLNSMDSSGLSSSSRGGLNGNSHHPPVAPARKKRMAPRPPSQNSIPEKAPLEINKDDHIFKEPQLPPYSRKNFHVSSPNLYNGELKTAEMVNNNNNNNNNDYNGPSETNGNGHHVETVEEMNNLINTKTSYSTLKNRPTSMYIIREPTDVEDQHQHQHQNDGGNLQRASLNGTGTSMQDIVNHSRTSSNSSEVKDPRDFQEAKKAKAPAPAPPPRGVSLGPKRGDVSEPTIVPTPSPRAPVRAAAAGDGHPVRDGETVISESSDSTFSETDSEMQKNRETVNKLNAVNSTHQPAAIPPSPLPSQNVSKVMLNVDQPSSLSSTDPLPSLSPEAERKPSSGASSVSIKIVNDSSSLPNGHSKPSTPIVSKVHIVPGSQRAEEETSDRRHSNGGGGDNSSDEDIKIYNIESGTEMRIPDKKELRSPSPEEEEQWTYTLPAPPKFADSSIKSGEYDEKQRYFELQSTFVDNTTIVTDRMTIGSDVTEEIRPIIREKVLLDESLEEKCSSPTETLVESEGGHSSVTTGEIMINSDIEDGYRGGSELRESMIQTLEKRREKLKESELQDLKESIEGGVVVERRSKEQVEDAEEVNESDIMKCAKLNEETVVDDYTMVVKRSSVVSVTRSQSVIESRRLSDERLPTESRKSEVISELSQVMKEENGLRGVLNGKKAQDEEEEIPGANKNSLSNFKISSYSGGTGENKENSQDNQGEAVNGKEEKLESIPAPSPLKSDSEEESNVIVRRKISADSILRGSKLSSDEDESSSAARFNNNNKNHQGPVKRRSLTVLNKSPKNINRSDSFHSTRSDYIQSLQSGGDNGLRMTPRSTSYISLIGAQKFENRFAQSNRRKSTSEMSICDSPSLQSLEVIKNILNSSRSNLAKEEKKELQEQEVMPMAAIKRNSFTDISTLVQYKSEVVRSNNLVRRESMVEHKIEEVESKKVFEEDEKEEKPTVEKIETVIVSKVEDSVSMKVTDSEKVMSERLVDVSNESKSDDEKLQNRQLSAAVAKQPQTTVVNITTTSTTVASSGVSVTVNAEQSDSAAAGGKRWTYQGPPTINFTTWSERPKIDVSIKSDRDYRFGGSSTLPRGYRNVNNTTKVNLNSTPAPSVEKENGIDQPDSREHVPLNNAEPQSLPQVDTNPPEPVSISSSDRLPIVRAVEYKKNVVPPPVAQKPLEKPYFYDTYSRNPAATVNRLSLGYNKFQPVVRGFKSMDEKDPPSKPRPVSMIESSHISTAILKTTPTRVEKPVAAEAPSLPFGQNTLRRTGLKDKILAQSIPEPPKPIAPEPTVLAIKAASVVAAPAPPPPPVAPKLTTPVVRGAIVKKPLPAPDVDPRTALLDAIRNFNKDKLRADL